MFSVAEGGDGEPAMRTSADCIVVDGAHQWYGKGDLGTYALRGVSVVARPGEVLMVRGPSGSGKTTLLQLMGALKTPDKGNLTICGESTKGMQSAALRDLRLRSVGFVFQFFNLFPTLTAWENVALPLDIRGVSRPDAERRAKALLEDVGLKDRVDYKPGQLSGGQRQRVAVARALANQPKVILADEPTAALDGVNGALVIKILRRLAHEEGRVVVIVSHDERVERMVDRAITVEDGRIVSDVSLSHSSPVPAFEKPRP
jgi:putative ABC transport system ATP-binding protein